MARVLALVPDLLFGSRVQGALTAAGDEVELIGDVPRLRERLSAPEEPPVRVLVVDLTDAQLDGAVVYESLAEHGLLEGIKTLKAAGAEIRADRARVENVDPDAKAEQLDAQHRIRLQAIERAREQLHTRTDALDADAHRALAEELDLEEQQIRRALGEPDARLPSASV